VKSFPVTTVNTAYQSSHAVSLKFQLSFIPPPLFLVHIFLKKRKTQPDIVVHICNPSTWIERARLVWTTQQDSVSKRQKALPFVTKVTFSNTFHAPDVSFSLFLWSCHNNINHHYC
jgi:hypothetical protein